MNGHCILIRIAVLLLAVYLAVSYARADYTLSATVQASQFGNPSTVTFQSSNDCATAIQNEEALMPTEAYAYASPTAVAARNSTFFNGPTETTSEATLSGQIIKFDDTPALRSLIPAGQSTLTLSLRYSVKAIANVPNAPQVFNQATQFLSATIIEQTPYTNSVTTGILDIENQSYIYYVAPSGTMSSFSQFGGSTFVDIPVVISPFVPNGLTVTSIPRAHSDGLSLNEFVTGGVAIGLPSEMPSDYTLPTSAGPITVSSSPDYIRLDDGSTVASHGVTFEITPCSMPNGEKIWGVDSDGKASVGFNWMGGVAPGGIGDSATFSTIITAPRTVTLDVDTTLGTITFDSPIGYTLVGTHVLTLQAPGAGAATITASNLHGDGAHTISAPVTLASDLNIVQDSAGTLRMTGPLNDSSAHTINKSGAGTTEISGLPTFGASTVINVNGGTFRFALASGMPSFAGAVTVTVNNFATLELAGAASALAAGSTRASIVNDSIAAAGIVVSGTHQQVGNIDGSGATQVNAGSDLMANHIIQTALVIGGTATNHGLVTIDPSDATGNPLVSLALPVPLAADAPLAESVEQGNSLNAIPVSGSATSSALNANSESPAVPEPPSAILLAVGGIALCGAVLRRQSKLAACLASAIAQLAATSIFRAIAHR